MYQVVLIDQKSGSQIGEIGEYDNYEEAQAEVSSYNQKSNRHRGRATVQTLISNPVSHSNLKIKGLRLKNNRENPHLMRQPEPRSNPEPVRRAPPFPHSKPTTPLIKGYEPQNTPSLSSLPPEAVLFVDTHTRQRKVLKNDLFFRNLISMYPERYQIVDRGSFVEMVRKRNQAIPSKGVPMTSTFRQNAPKVQYEGWKEYAQALKPFVDQKLKPSLIRDAWEELEGTVDFQGATAIFTNAEGYKIIKTEMDRPSSLLKAIHKLGKITDRRYLSEYRYPPDSLSSSKPEIPIIDWESQDPFAPDPYQEESFHSWSQGSMFGSKKSKPSKSYKPSKPSKPYVPAPLQPAYGLILINDEGKILVREPANHFSGTVWTFAKGKQDKGETPEQAALREGWEETGWNGEIIAPIEGEWSGMTSINKYFLGKPIGEQGEWEYQGTKKEETWRVEWVTQECAEILLSMSNKQTAQRDQEVLVKAFELWNSLQGSGYDL